MLPRIRQLAGLFAFILLWSVTGSAQTLEKLQETDRYTDYEIRNDDLRISLPHQLTIPYSSGRSYEILDQETVAVTLPDTAGYHQPLMDNISPAGTPILETKNPGMMRGKPVASLIAHTARRDQVDTTRFQVARRLSFRVYKPAETPQQRTAEAFETSNSPLDSGEWYRIRYENEGIHEIDREYLEGLGIEVDQIDPRNIQIWTTDGYPLPYRNDAPRPELSQVPVIVEGQDNGSFDDGDRIIFFGNSVNRVYYDDENERFAHQKHHSDRRNTIFLKIGSSEGERLDPVTLNSPTRTVETFREFLWKEEHQHKSESGIKSGLGWFGQVFEATGGGQRVNIFNENVPGIDLSEPVELHISVAGRSTAGSSFQLYLNDEPLDPISVPSIRDYSGSEWHSARITSESFEISGISIPDEQIDLQASFISGHSGGRGWIDYINLHLTRELIAREDKLLFNTPDDGSVSEIATYRLQGFENEPYVMEVSNPVEPVWLPVSSAGNDYEINYHTEPGTRMIAQSELYQPLDGERIENQNIRGISYHPDYIIITHERLYEQAQKLADYRSERDGLTPVVVTQQQVLDEFNGGVRDFVALRDYVKFLYDRALSSGREAPKYLLLFGNATFDHKGIMAGARMENLVMTFQSEESVHRTNTFASDDWFALLDDDEGEWASGSSERIDMGVGRFPVQTPEEAELLIDKIQTYENDTNKQDWRSLFTFIADDDQVPSGNDDDLHIVNADVTADQIDREETGLRIDKIYQIDYPIESTAAGARVPQATQALIDRFNEGSLVMNFSGHGNERWLTDQRLFSIDDIPRLDNSENLSIFVTATCEFGRYDDNERYSGAEKMLLHENGGVVAALTTTRVVFTSRSIGANNFGLNVELTREMVRRDEDGRPQTLGEIFRKTKNTTYGSSFNNRKFSLLGDPAMRIGLPEEKMEITHINGEPVAEQDSIRLRALDHVSVQGQAVSYSGEPLSDFNGNATLRLFDAERLVSYPSDRDWIPGRCTLDDCGYYIQNDLLFNGQVTVENGVFNGEFVIPKNIAYSQEPGRIHLYASGPDMDAVGSFSNFSVNGLNPDAEDDGEGPELEVYLNDESFFSGDMVNDDPTLLVNLHDESGINTSGGIGHDLVAILRESPDDSGQQTFVLNDFYQSEINDFTRGSIEYPITGLDNGRYELTVRAWDIFNNPGEETIEFEVQSGDDLVVRDVYNYPNPMHNFTRFVFEHNQPGSALDVMIRIYTPAGTPVRTINRDGVIPSGNLVQIEFDGYDDDGHRLANGTYIYHVRVRTETTNGSKSTDHIERLVILR